MHFLSSDSKQRGGALIVAILISAIIGISLLSYINLSLNSLKLSDRTFYSNAALNFAELGLEEALHRYNQLSNYSNPADAWSGWTISGNTVRKKFTGFTPGPGVTGEVRVFCEHYNPGSTANPYVISETTIALPQGPPLKKLVKINIRRRSIFGGGLTARNGVSLFGSASADSYQSDPDDNPSTPPVLYTPGNRRDNVLVASAATANFALDVSGSNVEVFGRVATGGGAIKTSSGTWIHDEDSAALPLVDPSLVTTDFLATFPPVSVPSPVVVNLISADVTSTTSFPRGGDAAAADGRFYYRFDSGSEISLPNLGAITVTDDVTWILNDHDGSVAIHFSNSNTLTILATGSLEVYTDGDIYISNSGQINPTLDPGKCIIYGTNSTIGGQEIIFNSANMVNAGIYAPNADVAANSSVSISGAVVANTIELNNSATLHFDESLGLNGGNPYHLSHWTELKSASQREAFASQLGF